MDLNHKEKKSSTTDKLTLTQNCGTSRKMKKHSWPWSLNEENPKKNRKFSLPVNSRLVRIEENGRQHRICSCNVTRSDYFRNDRKEEKEFWKNRTFHWPFSSKFPDSEDFISGGVTCFYWRKKLTRSKSVTHESKDQKDKEDSSFVSDFCNEVLCGRNNSKFQESDIVLQSMDNPNPANLVRRFSAPGILGHSVTRCNVCTHLSKSVALFVPDCGVNVHENSCKDQIAQCSKFPHTKVSAILRCFVNRK